MKGLAIGLCVPTIIFATLFGIERMNHQTTQAELATTSQKLAAGAALQESHQEEMANLDSQLNALRQSHNQYVTNARTQIEDLEAARDKAQLALAEANKAAKLTRSNKVVDADLNADNDPKAAFAQTLGKSLTKMFDAPAMKERMRTGQLKRLNKTHAALFKKLGLSKDEIDTFKNLLVDSRMSGMNNGLSILNGAGDQAGIQTAIADLNAKKEAADAEIKTFLGEDGYQTYKRYEETLPQRQTVDRVAKALADTDAPLTDAQSDRLIDLMHETQTAARAESMKEIVQKSDDGNSFVVSLDSNEFQERNKAQNDLVLKQTKEEGLLDDNQQAALEKQLAKQANNPFGALMHGGGISFGDNGIGGSISIQTTAEAIEVE